MTMTPTTTTTTPPQGIADTDTDNVSGDPFDEGFVSPYQARRAAHLNRMWQTPFPAPSVPPVAQDGWCAECGGCTDQQDMEARQMGVACRCDEGEGR